jgi:hypothetical protein
MTQIGKDHDDRSAICVIGVEFQGLQTQAAEQAF